MTHPSKNTVKRHVKVTSLYDAIQVNEEVQPANKLNLLHELLHHLNLKQYVEEVAKAKAIEKFNHSN